MIFIDTGFFYALFSSADPDHQRVRAVLEEYRSSHIQGSFLTTNHVVAETITLIRMTPPRSHEAAAKAGDFLYSEVLAKIHWATPDEEEAAFAYFKRYSDKEYSFVDCLSFMVMKARGITEAFAVDSDFTHEFVARPGPKLR